MPALVVASATAPMAAITLADPMSHGFGITRMPGVGSMGGL